ncbi:MAG: hypothetical protein ABI333_16035 [bacterium]
MRREPFGLALLITVVLAIAGAGCGGYTASGNDNNNNDGNSNDCDGGGCVTDKANGEACAAGSECASGFCPTADGVCCDAACNTLCLACLESKTGDADGTCAPVTADTDPDGECADLGPESCGGDGSGCNGDAVAPGCNLYDSSTVCEDADCTAGVQTPARYCDGAGTCEVATPANCEPFACNAAGTACLASCGGDGDCDASSYCDGAGACVPKSGDGTACTDDRQCLNGHCVDGLCCDAACDSTCEACDAARTGGADGVCGPVLVDTDPDGECTAEGPATCGIDGTGCNGSATSPGCNLYDGTTMCAVAGCSGSTLTLPGFCDGAGTCGAGASTPCDPYLCDPGGTACRTSCISHTDCSATAYCDGMGTCAPKLQNGAACAIGLQCASGFCPPFDGVCCDLACDGTCEACLASKTNAADGTCAAVDQNTDPDGECSDAGAASCGANGTGCNGNSGSPGCNVYSSSTVCAAPGCSNGVEGGTRYCDGLGTCQTAGSILCDPYVCNSGGTACLTSCAAHADCMTGFYCDGTGVCQPKLANGGVCAIGVQCLSGLCPAQDGVCCDAACGGTCEACTAAKTGGTDGTCGPVTASTNPDGECTGADTCNGAGACGCADGVQNGAETDIDCGGGVCSPCSQGQTCVAGTDCVSGNCPAGDGVCCNLPCSGPCVACTAAKTGGTDGTCNPVTGGADPDNDCTGADVCNGFGVCRCTDGLVNGSETDTDCGGGVCPACAGGQHCNAPSDCANGICPADDGVCCDAACNATCESCLGANTGGADGTCDFVTVNTDPDAECPLDQCDGAGTCYDACSTVSCLTDADCTPGATADLCLDVADDCQRTACVGATPGTDVEAGAPMSEDFNTWQPGDDESGRGSEYWYCNATLPVTAAGTLTNWELYVDNNGGNGEVAQLAVIRCTTGGGGSGGPVLGGCSRVGLGPMQSVTGDGLHTYTLAGSTQLDGAAADPLGIVVQPGDIICADANFYDIGIDCNASSTTGGCPGPTFNTQYYANLDTVGEPFTIWDSTHNGTLMIKAYGSTPTVPGTCSDLDPEPDTTLCSGSGGADTCCSGACIVGPGGAGTCN